MHAGLAYTRLALALAVSAPAILPLIPDPRARAAPIRHSYHSVIITAGAMFHRAGYSRHDVPLSRLELMIIRTSKQILILAVPVGHSYGRCQDGCISPRHPGLLAS